ncbi:dehydration-responsive element-binding protein 1B [Ricinus communis]|uniref:Dehydration-responsive element-binding protein 1B, putative n=1 Tax=Ricinus communis TaxID=3988 RepID=B9SRI0_RICCO|nr:dehydration-responsive element-binding protein 1B [Ricinus communis]EEF33807.1 Dehydration-responsive element-binding protein 1B, putative [Ricinus communis]
MEFKQDPSPIPSSTNSHQNNHPNPHSPSMATKKRKAGRKKFQETRHPVYNGVRRRNGKWVSELRQPYNNKSRIWLGTFPSPDMAARAYDVAAFALRGDSASLNFPESVHLLPQARSTSIKDIQYAALEAADQSVSGGGGGGSDVDHLFQCSSSSLSFCSSTIEGSDNVGKDWNKNMNMFLDEEELFNMPALLDSMAEGLILTPPAMKKGFNWNNVEDDPVDLFFWTD